MKTWSEWKQAYLAAYARGVNRQCAGATDKPFSLAANLVMLPAAHDVMGALAGLLDNLTLAATTDRTTVQPHVGKPLAINVGCNSNGGKQKANQNGGLLQLRASGTWQWHRTWGRQCPLWLQSSLGQLLLDAWVQGIAYQQNLQCDQVETGAQ
jgi:hypothetical protein